MKHGDQVVKVAFGIKAHSGWGALVVVGKRDGDFVVVERYRIKLADEQWAKQPYHAAKDLELDAARAVVKRGIEGAHRIAVREMKAMVKREKERDNEVKACAVLVGSPMPDWSIEEILGVHFRMHKAEGVLFQEALAGAAKSCGLRLVAIPEKQLMNQAERDLGIPESVLVKQISVLGKTAGPPWGKDQKEAALAAMIALQG